MAYDINPHGDLQLSIDPYPSRPEDTIREHRRRSAYAAKVPRKPHQHRRAYHYWVFSSASNVHLATDGTSSRSQTTYESPALTLAD